MLGQCGKEIKKKKRKDFYETLWEIEKTPPHNFFYHFKDKLHNIGQHSICCDLSTSSLDLDQSGRDFRAIINYFHL